MLPSDSSSGQSDATRHFYYDNGWQCLEEHLDDGETAEHQFIWGLRYIDDLVLRDRDTDSNGTLNERFVSVPRTTVVCLLSGAGEGFS